MQQITPEAAFQQLNISNELFVLLLLVWVAYLARRGWKGNLSKDISCLMGLIFFAVMVKMDAFQNFPAFNILMNLMIAGVALEVVLSIIEPKVNVLVGWLFEQKQKAQCKKIAESSVVGAQYALKKGFYAVLYWTAKILILEIPGTGAETVNKDLTPLNCTEKTA